MKSYVQSTSSSAFISKNLSDPSLVKAPLLSLDSTARIQKLNNAFISVTEPVYFFGGSSYLAVTVPGIPTGSMPRTVEAMAYFTSDPSANNGSIIQWGTGSTGTDYCLVPRGGEISNHFGGHFWSQNLDSGKAISDFGYSKWIHVCMTNLSGVQKIYLNGTLYGQSSFSLNTGNSAVNIGRRGTQNEFTSGYFREVRIWNKALTVDQIQDLVNTRLEFIPQGLIFYSRLNQTPAATTDLAQAATITQGGTVGTQTMTYTVFQRRTSAVL